MTISTVSPRPTWAPSRRERRARWAFFVVLSVLSIVGFALLSEAALADPADFPRHDLVKLLGDRYAEAPVAVGLTDDGGVLEVLAAVDGSTWTIIVTSPDGMSRVVGAGESWPDVTSAPGQRI